MTDTQPDLRDDIDLDAWLAAPLHDPSWADGQPWAHDYVESAVPDETPVEWRCRRCVLAMEANVQNLGPGFQTDEVGYHDRDGTWIGWAHRFADLYGWQA